MQVLLGSTLLVIGFSFFMGSPGNNNFDDLPWNAKALSATQVKALGLITEQSTLQDAVNLYGKDLQVKIFSNREREPKSLEAYFDVVYIGGLKFKLVINLKTNAEELAQLAQGKAFMLLDSGDREADLTRDEKFALLNHKISVITLIPSNDLDEVTIEKRFGPADNKTTDDLGMVHYFVKNKGLEIIIDPQGKEVLQYYAQP